MICFLDRYILEPNRKRALRWGQARGKDRRSGAVVWLRCAAVRARPVGDRAYNRNRLPHCRPGHRPGALTPPTAKPSPRSLRPWPIPAWKRCGRKSTNCAPRGGGEGKQVNLANVSAHRLRTRQSEQYGAAPGSPPSLTPCFFRLALPGAVSSIVWW